ncbi:S-methyl-5'-thioadenosine phosphorylase [Gallionella capsiferriformans]|uniref:S-methyl-5'-thioadenosine phosphorylase n=1 Tax=Gallionella capsiferriformans (strain ES-2) TaxID=395494 RepID=D9SHD8_GALCS|nr:S-methyl-5'-thioadenosine phosphorylase [Gallionella capsiferriformans]ADL55935.1 methylthioadenosine phosphorylase [Gallionella capsiferriformans ES-2]
MTRAMIGVIGGSGLYQMDSLTEAEEHIVETPFGRPSDVVVTGKVNGTQVAFLARHGKGHRLIPTEIPYRANIYALKSLGVRYLISVSAVGSLREEICPLDMVLPDQFIDLTKHRISTFFGNDTVAHVSMARPVCPMLSDLLAQAIESQNFTDLKLHKGGTYVCIEGPSFSSVAESHWYRSMGANIIGMTNMPEAKLAREAQISYATLALATDYDCWHPKEEHVTADIAIANLMKNAEHAQSVLSSAISLIDQKRPISIAHNALNSSLVTPLAAMSAEAGNRLNILLQ